MVPYICRTTKPLSKLQLHVAVPEHRRICLTGLRAATAVMNMCLIRALLGLAMQTHNGSESSGLSSAPHRQLFWLHLIRGGTPYEMSEPLTSKSPSTRRSSAPTCTKQH